MQSNDVILGAHKIRVCVYGILFMVSIWWSVIVESQNELV